MAKAARTSHTNRRRITEEFVLCSSRIAIVSIDHLRSKTAEVVDSSSLIPQKFSVTLAVIARGVT
jgi:hypothetical protein